ncbi:MAG: DegT/DnrJ/EryC1/StrS family aminotransferase [Dehalococcoidia bacterium]|nr:DegT/DnrJ/EryC1/StrS family aminotransferase [Dehalococcoidia bacterium]
MKVEYSYLKRQFNPDEPRAKAILADLRKELYECQFTLGPWVTRFEQAFAEACGVKHAIGVNSGMDALKALGIKAGDKVLTTPNTFIATAGAIVELGAIPTFVDVGDDYLLDLKAAAKLQKQMKATIPVDLTGNPVVLDSKVKLNGIIVRDSCQAAGARINGTPAAKTGNASAFSLHPLKNVNVWGDGGVIVTDDDALAKELRLLRNHGLQDWDTVVVLGHNSQLDAIQAIVAFHALKEMDELTDRRVANAARYDAGLEECPGVKLPPRNPKVRQVCHTCVIQVERCKELQAYLEKKGLETEVHYPMPLRLQPGLKYLGYKKGDFPKTEAQTARILTLLIHQYLKNDEIDYVIESLHGFYRQRN